MAKIDSELINEAKFLALDMISNANSGHPGSTIDITDILYVLYTKVMNINPDIPNWINRDRLVLSAGHASAALYANLFFAGYDIKMEDLKNFRKFGSITPGHPNYLKTPGIDATTGMLGEGIATAVGIALGQRYFEDLIGKEKPKNKLIDYYTYCICGDGDLMEGVSYEALSLAGLQKLNKFILIYNSNKVTLDGDINLSFNENILDRFESINFNTIEVKKSSASTLLEAFNNAKKSKRPTVIVVHNTIGKGTSLEGTNKVHGKPLKKDEIAKLKRKEDHKTEEFYVDDINLLSYRKMVKDKANKNHKKWLSEYDEALALKNSDLNDIINHLNSSKVSLDLESLNFKINDDYEEELRKSNQKIMNVISNKTNFFIGGSADLNSSCKTSLVKSRYMSSKEPSGKNIAFGVREHAMGSILNGLALTGLKVFGSTFLTFSDYVKPAIRMSAMMNLPVTYIFTHDSFTIGEDGMTHQPIEQLSSLRMIPNFYTFRPADINELIGSWDTIIKKELPSSLVVSKEKLKNIKNTNRKYVKYGAYMIRKEKHVLHGVIIATGSEVSLAIDVAEILYKIGIDLRVVSMPCVELFVKQNPKYEKELLPKTVKIFAIEAGSKLLWNRFTTSSDCIFGLDDFGKCGSKDELNNYYGMNIKKIAEKIKRELIPDSSTEFLD